MLRTSLKLAAFSALICTGAVRADLSEITPKDTVSALEGKKDKKPKVIIPASQVTAPAPEAKSIEATEQEASKPEATKAPEVKQTEEKKSVSPDVEGAVAPSVSRFAQIKNLCARVTEVPAAATAVVTALKAKALAHPYIAGAAAATVVAVAIYAIVAKAEKKPARAARR